MKDLRLDRKKFGKEIDTHVIGITYYINELEGVMYEIQDERAEVIRYFPPAKYDHLYCGQSEVLPASKTVSSLVWAWS